MEKDVAKDNSDIGYNQARDWLRFDSWMVYLKHVHYKCIYGRKVGKTESMCLWRSFSET